MTTFSHEEIEYLISTVQEARSLLDSVHCYDTKEFTKLAVANDILNGLSLEDAINENTQGN